MPCHLYYLIHISEIHAFNQTNQFKKQGFQTVKKSIHCMAIAFWYTPAQGGTAYDTQKAADNQS